MRTRLALAIFVSILLVGTASWSRFSTTSYTQPDLIAIKNMGAGDIQDETFLKDFLNPKTVGSASTTETLSNTDLIGRGLIMDYIGLAASGGAGTDSINALADRYIESIPTLNKAVALSLTDLKIVPDNKLNFQQYADQITKIYKAYANSINQISADGNLNTLNLQLYSSALSFSNTYTDTVTKLKSLPVPNALSQAHLELINNYLSSATAMKALSETEKDSASAFAGLIALNDNMGKEKVILDTISQILTVNGI